MYELLFTWNILNATLVTWLACVFVAVAVDYTPEIYRELKARRTLEKKTIPMLAEKKPFDPDRTMKLAVVRNLPTSRSRRRHKKKIAA